MMAKKNSFFAPNFYLQNFDETANGYASHKPDIYFRMIEIRKGLASPALQSQLRENFNILLHHRFSCDEA